MKAGGYRVEPNGALTIFASRRPLAVKPLCSIKNPTIRPQGFAMARVNIPYVETYTDHTGKARYVTAATVAG